MQRWRKGQFGWPEICQIKHKTKDTVPNDKHVPHDRTCNGAIQNRGQKNTVTNNSMSPKKIHKEQCNDITVRKHLNACYKHGGHVQHRKAHVHREMKEVRGNPVRDQLSALNTYHSQQLGLLFHL